MIQANDTEGHSIEERKRAEYNLKKRQRWANDPEWRAKLLDGCRKSRIKRKQKIRDTAKRWEERNREKYRAGKKRYREKHHAKVRAAWSLYAKKNRGKVNAKSSIARAKRRKNDPVFRMANSVRNRIIGLMKQKFVSKGNSTLKILGCDIPHLRKHLESKFKSGMTWDNYGHYGWHIDHIKPLASFDLSDHSQQLLAFGWENLQPLWWWENIAKGAKIQP